MSKVQLKVKSPTVDERTGEKDGRQWKVRSQSGFVELANGETRLVKIRLESDQLPYPPGPYFVDLAEMLGVSQYGQLELGRQLAIYPEAK